MSEGLSQNVIENMPEQVELKPVVGVWGLAFTIVNFIVGAGIFVLPAVVGMQLGAFALPGYLACGLIIGSIMLCYAEIGSKVAGSGGSYAYVREAFGRYPAFLVNWLFLIAWSILSDAAILNIFADSIAVIYPVFSEKWARILLFLCSLFTMVVVNVWGVRRGIVVIKWITAIKLIPLLGIVVLGFTQIKVEKLYWENLPPMAVLGNGMLTLFFAFPGFESALGMSGEIKNPQKSIPRGLLVGGLFVLVFYMLLQAVSQGVLSNQFEASKDAPLAAVAEKLVGPVGASVLLLTAALSCFGTLFADLLTAPRCLYAAAKDGMFPAFLAKINRRFATPASAIVLYGVLLFVVAVSGGFQQLAILASAAILLIYLAVVLATIRLRWKFQTANQKTFRIPGGLTIPIIAIVSIAWLMSGLSRAEWMATVAFLCAATLFYFIASWNSRRKKSQEPV